MITKLGFNTAKYAAFILMTVMYCCSCGDSMITLDADNQTIIIQNQSTINIIENSSLITEQISQLDEVTQQNYTLLLDSEENLSIDYQENTQLQNLQQQNQQIRQLGTNDNNLSSVIDSIITQLPLLQQYPIWLNSSEIQYNKFLKDTYNYYITPQGNKIWVCVMTLAWTQMKFHLLSGHNATFSNMTPLQSHLVDNFNADVFQSNQLSQDSFYVHSGYGPKTIQRINFDLKKKFPLRTLPMLQYSLQQTDFISYAYLFKKFHFVTEFNDALGFFFKNQPVRAFQTKTQKQKRQLYVKYYNSSEDFMIGIKTKSRQDEIVLWKTDNKEINSMRLQKVLQLFTMLYSSQNQQFSNFDKFIMPIVDLDISKQYSEMIDMNFTNQQLDGYHIKEMRENVKLRVTKEGVKLQAQGIIIGTRSIQIVDRTFYLDKDFWLILKQKNKQPYLITLISTVVQSWEQ